MTATFALTFDTELVWGSFDHVSPAVFEQRYPDIRTTVRSILDLLDRHEVPATWAVVGHLFLSGCSRDANGVAHPELVHPRQSGRPAWLSADPCTDVRHDPLWYGPDIIDRILAARTAHEIGSHSFSHARFDDPRMTAEMVRSDLRQCVELAAARGITLRSFVFPRNGEAHHDLLREAGFCAYRGMDPSWGSSLPGTIGRAARLLDQVLGTAPPVTCPEETHAGLWNIPGSSLIAHRAGVRRAISVASRIRKARMGLASARENGGVFHVWTHPFNIANDPPHMLASLEGILREVVRARDSGWLVTDTMSGIAARAAMSGGLGE